MNNLLPLHHDESDEKNHTINKVARQNKSVKSFICYYNSTRISDQQLHFACMFKWLKAYHRGDLEDWGGINDMNKKSSKVKLIMHHIYHNIKLRDSTAAKWNKIVMKSLHAPDQYGVVAKRLIPKGTIVGFFEGTLALGSTMIPLNDFHHKCMMLNDFSFVDGSLHMSCFARYYAVSADATIQNLFVHRPATWTDHNRAICFISNRDILKGEELVTS